MGEASVTPQRLSGKPFALWVIFGSLVYFGLALIALILPLLVSAPSAAADPIILSSLVLGAVSVVGGYLALRGRLWGVVLALLLSVIFLGFFVPFLAPILANPADPTYWLAISGIPALGLAATFSILSLLRFRRGISQVPYLASPKSGGGLLTIAVVGFVVGGIVVGAFASALVAQIVASGGAGADVRIVPNASNPQVAAPYSPRTFTVRAGTAVIWFNADTMIHSVTSDTGAFDSGNLAPGLFYQRTFTTPGTYAYHCTPHPGMTGTIVVTP